MSSFIDRLLAPFARLAKQPLESFIHLETADDEQTLVAEDGSLVRVIAAPQPVLRITHCTAHGTPFDLTRAAYHLGNRHVPIELKPDHLKIEPDHVLAELLTSYSTRLNSKSFVSVMASVGHASTHRSQWMQRR